MPRATGTGEARTYASLDWLKLILSLAIVCIHADLWRGEPPVILWCAVPLFFVMSSYFFWCRAGQLDGKERRAALGKFLLRSGRLYLFWFILLLPLTLAIRDYLSAGVGTGVWHLIRDLLFGSTFRSSWFLSALCLGMVIVYLLSVRLPAWAVLLLTLPAYLLCCLFHNYYGLIADCGWLIRLYQGYLSIFGTFANSFPEALFWVALGRWLAGRAKKAPGPRPVGRLVVRLILTGLCVGLLVGEKYLVDSIGGAAARNFYVSLVPLCALSFPLLRDMPWPARMSGPRLTGTLRRLSTVTFCLHASVITVVDALLRRLFPAGEHWHRAVTVLITLAVCLAVYSVFTLLERHRPLRFLKYAH